MFTECSQEYELAVAAAQQAKIDEQNKRKEDAKETTRLLAEAKAARVAETEVEREVCGPVHQDLHVQRGCNEKRDRSFINSSNDCPLSLYIICSTSVSLAI
jgi:hypothetical protein